MRNQKEKKQKKEVAVIERKKLKAIYVLTFIVAFCSMLYELLLAQTISLVAGNAIFWYSITVGFFLGSLGVGSILSEKIEKENTIKNLFLVEISLAFFGAFAVCSMRFVQLIDMYFLSHGNQKIALFFMLLGSQLVVVIIGFLSGFELPMLMNVANKYSTKKIVTNRILAVDYFASLFSAILFPIFFITVFNIITVGFLTAIINLIAAIYLVKIFLEKEKKNKSRFIIALLLMGSFFFGILKADNIEKYFSEKYFYYPQALHRFRDIFLPLKDAPKIETYNSAYQKIDIIDGQTFNAADIVMDAYTDKLVFEPDFPIGKELYLNGDWQFNSGTEEIYHEYFAHVPILATDKVPEKVLVLGGGDGMLTRELLKYQDIKEIVQVEIDPEMIRLGKEHPLFLAMNKDSLSNKRVDLKVADAYSFVRDSKDQFDAIYMDFPLAVDYNISRLYSKEFYSFVKNRLKDDGFLVFDAPGIASHIESTENGLRILEDKKSPWKEYVNTVKSAGFEKIVPFISYLEEDNKQARFLAKEYILEKNKEQISEQEMEEIVNQIIDSFVSGSQESFIFAQKSNEKELSFHSPKINTYLLNEKRFERSLRIEYTPIEGIEEEYVNSVTKPTLPKRDFWQIRFPYYIQ